MKAREARSESREEDREEREAGRAVRVERGRDKREVM